MVEAEWEEVFNDTWRRVGERSKSRCGTHLREVGWLQPAQVLLGKAVFAGSGGLGQGWIDRGQVLE